MIQFPETVQAEWDRVANAAKASARLRAQIEHDTRVERETELVRIRYEAKLKHQQELDADQTPALEMTTLADYQSNPAAAPADLIDGVLKSDGLCVVVGPSGSGKSTLALQMLHSLSTGVTWLEQDVKPIMGGIGIMSYDMDASMVMDWMVGFPNMDASKVSVVNAYKRGNPLGVPDMRSKIAESWRNLGVEIVVIDSFSASFFGESQNDAAATMHHYRDLKLFALTECEAKALIVIAHSTEGNPFKARGSTVHQDVADSIVGVEVLPPGGTKGPRKIEMAKYRAARGQKQMDTRIVGAPDDVTHLVSLDTGAMTLAGLPLPPSVGAAAFELPETNEAPEAQDNESEQEDDDL